MSVSVSQTLIPVQVSVTSNAQVGQWVIGNSTSHIQVRMPDPTTVAPGSLIGVTNLSPTTGLTVTGTLIQGVGVSSLSSVALGSYGSYAKFMSDGTQWNIIAGQQDTGWQSFTFLVSNVSANDGVGMIGSVRVQGDNVQFKGHLVNNGPLITEGTLIASIASSAIPNCEIISFPIIDGADQHFALGMAGSLSAVYPPPGQFWFNFDWPNADEISLDGIRYTLS